MQKSEVPAAEQLDRDQAVAEQLVDRQDATMAVGAIAVSNVCPFDHHTVAEEPTGPSKRWGTTVGAHNKIYGPVGKELEHVTGVMNTKLADSLHDSMNQVGNGDPVTDWVEANLTTPALELPYGAAKDLRADPYRELPTTFFDGVDGQGMVPVIPRTWLGRRKLVRQHEARQAKMRQDHQTAINDGDYRKSGELTDSINAQLRRPSDIYMALRAMRREGVVIDPVTWSEHVDKARNSKADDAWIDIEAMIRGRNESVQPLLGTRDRDRRELATGRFGSYIFQGHRAGRISYMTMDKNGMIMPVGEYGPELAEVLLHTAQYTMDQTSALAGEAGQLAEHHSVVLQDHTARGGDATDVGGGGPAAGLIDTVQEGVITTAYALAFLTAEKVEGYDDPMALLQAIKEAGLVNKLTSVIPMGVIGPFVNAGAYLKGLVQKDKDGALQLNPDVVDALKAARSTQIKRAIGEWARRRYERYKHGTDMTAERQNEEISRGLGFSIRLGNLGMICPAARRGGGLDKVSDAMVDTALATKG